jgi:OFA family oxalate/formate antiporter-like MFS transporter
MSVNHYVNNRWFQMVALVIAMVMIANLQYGWTLLVKSLQDDHGWSLADVQWAFTLFILFQTWVQPLDGWLIDRMGPRIFFSVAGILSGLGWTALAFVQSLTQLYAAYALAGAGAALVYSGSIGSALKWFKARRGLAAGVIAAGYGAGTALFIPIIAYLVETRGYRSAFIWTGIVPGLIVLVIAQVVRHPPAEDLDKTIVRGKRSDLQQPTVRRTEEHFATMEMLHTPQFYLLYAMFVLMATGGLLVTAQAGPVAASWGLPLAALTTATALSPLANGGSRIFWGWVSDHFGRENTMAVSFGLNAVALVCVMRFGRISGTLFSAALVMTYFTWGQTFSIFPSTLADWFGTRHSTSNYTFLYTAKGVASILGGGVAALLFQHFGNWSSAFYGSAAFALTAAVLALVLRATPMPRRADVAVEPLGTTPPPAATA